MKTRLTILVCIALVFGMLAASCAKPPTEEMNNATEAVTRAENDIDAVTYAGNLVSRARDALSRMQAESNNKRYDAAKTYAAEAIANAERAIADGRAGAARFRDEAAALVAELRPMVVETGLAIASAQEAGLDLDFEEVNNDFDNARSDTEQAETALNGQRYQESLRLGRIARSEFAEINVKLSNAASAASRKK